MNLSDFKHPNIKMVNIETGKYICEYHLDEIGDNPSAIMACLIKNRSNVWSFRAIGLPSEVKCCGNFRRIKSQISDLKLD